MDITRRQLVALGVAEAAGTIVSGVAIAEWPASAEPRLGGVHVYCLLRGVSPPFTGFPCSVMVTVWGEDNALNGIGWGATIEGGDRAQSYLGAGLNPIILAVQGSVEGDIVNMKATLIFAGLQIDQGLPWLIEANLTTGLVHAVEVNPEGGTEIVFEGEGVVSRI